MSLFQHLGTKLQSWLEGEDPFSFESQSPTEGPARRQAPCGTAQGDHEGEDEGDPAGLRWHRARIHIGPDA